MSIDVLLLEGPSPGALPLEIVERKGLGHPDTICDALAETVSRALSRFYIERCGLILHHNVDKALLCGGAARPAFGGGELLAPIEFHLAGRATRHFDGIEVPVDDIAIENCCNWIREHLPELDPERDVRIVPHIRPASSDLASLFVRGGGKPLANDTSFGVGFAPLDALERMVLAVEQHLNEPAIKHAHPAIGADVKVMGARYKEEMQLTVACALVGRHIADLSSYWHKKAHICALVQGAIQGMSTVPVRISVNTADGETAESVYLTVTGLSAESGDDGQVGRGNRVNGLITPYRPMSLEAAAGKNPVTHVGKLYNVMAHRVAHAVVTRVPEVEESYCYLLSRIGRPITDPQLFEIKVRLKDAEQLDALRPRVQTVAQETFSEIDSIWREAVEGTLPLW